MSEKQWFICISENVLGPLETKTVHLMVQQSRLQFNDYVWRAGLKKWTPLFEMTEFASLAPPYPKAPIPESEKPVRPVAAGEKPPASASKVRMTDRIAASGKVSIDGSGQFEIIDLSISGVFITCSLKL